MDQNDRNEEGACTLSATLIASPPCSLLVLCVILSTRASRACCFFLLFSPWMGISPCSRWYSTSTLQSYLVLQDNKLQQWFLSLCKQWYIFTCNSEFEFRYGCNDESLLWCIGIQHNGSSLGNQPTFNPLVTYYGKIACCIFNNNIETYCIYFMVIL
jgi:hypothetical protein